MYLGEITRNILLSLIDSVPPLLFNGRSTPLLNSHYGFDSAYMSAIESATSVAGVKSILVERLGFELEQVTDDDAEIVRRCCEAAATRAAHLSGCALSAVLIQTGRAKLDGDVVRGEETYKVGVDGRYEIISTL